MKVPKEDYPQMPMKEIDQAASICKGASPEEAQDFGRGLYMYMSRLGAAHGLLPLLLRIDTGKQLANLLTVHSPHLANEPQSAVEALKSWKDWVQMRGVSKEATYQQKAGFQEKLTAVLTPLAEEAMDWGKVGAVLGMDENLSWDLRMQLTGVDSKQELWEGIFKLVLEAKYKEHLDAVDKTIQKNMATKEVPDWAMKFKALPQFNSTTSRSSLLPQGQGTGQMNQHAQAYQQMSTGNVNQTEWGSQSQGQGNFMPPPPVHFQQMQGYPGPHSSGGQGQAEQVPYAANPMLQWMHVNQRHSLLPQGTGSGLSHTQGG